MTVAAQAQPARRISRLSITSWVLYDLANTIFSLNIVSLYFSLWVVNAMGSTDQAYGYANSFSMALMFVSAPILGALSDQAPRRLPFLIVSTVTCVTFTLFLGSGGLVLSLLAFIIANYFYQAGLIFYDSLLPEVSTEQNRGRISGIGIGIGYLGSVIGLAAGYFLLPKEPVDPAPGDYANVFRVTAVLFLVFATPAFLFIRERPRTRRPLGTAAMRGAIRELRQTVRRARQYRQLTRFLVGRIFYAEAANTLIAFMGIYVTNELGFSDSEVQLVLLAGILAAIPAGLVWGVVVDRIGPKRTLNIVLVLWMFVLALTIAIPTLNLPAALFWANGVLAGVALAGLWSADRPYMLRLSPPRYLGQFYGLYSMVGRFAAIIGPFMWGTIVTGLGWGRPAAVASLLGFIVISFVIMQGVSDVQRPWSVDELDPQPAAAQG